MAETPLVDPNRPFYESFLPAVRALNTEHGPLYLAVVMQFEGAAEDAWTMLIGSRELQSDRSDAPQTVAQALADHAPPGVTRRIRRIGIIAEDDPIFRAFTSTIDKRLDGVISYERCNLSGLEIPRAGVFVSIRDVIKLMERTRKKRTLTKKRRRR